MIAFISILVSINAVLGYLLYAQTAKVEKLDKNQAIMIGWFDTINKNEQTLKDDVQKLYNEFKRTEEKSQRRPLGPQAKDALRPR
jgi:rubrerythrin